MKSCFARLGRGGFDFIWSRRRRFQPRQRRGFHRAEHDFTNNRDSSNLNEKTQKYLFVYPSRRLGISSPHKVLITLNFTHKVKFIRKLRKSFCPCYDDIRSLRNGWNQPLLHSQQMTTGRGIIIILRFLLLRVINICRWKKVLVYFALIWYNIRAKQI